MAKLGKKSRRVKQVQSRHASFRCSLILSSVEMGHHFKFLTRSLMLIPSLNTDVSILNTKKACFLGEFRPPPAVNSSPARCLSSSSWYCCLQSTPVKGVALQSHVELSQ